MSQNVVTYTVEVNCDNSDEKLLPYLTTNLQFEVGHRGNVLLVPNAALRWAPGAAGRAWHRARCPKLGPAPSGTRRGAPEGTGPRVAPGDCLGPPWR